MLNRFKIFDVENMALSLIAKHCLYLHTNFDFGIIDFTQKVRQSLCAAVETNQRIDSGLIRRSREAVISALCERLHRTGAREFKPFGNRLGRIGGVQLGRAKDLPGVRALVGDELLLVAQAPGAALREQSSFAGHIL